jgi:hypothetical protein
MKDKRLELIKKRARKVWIINPQTRTKGNDKAYNRKKEKAKFRKESSTMGEEM